MDTEIYKTSEKTDVVLFEDKILKVRTLYNNDYLFDYFNDTSDISKCEYTLNHSEKILTISGLYSASLDFKQAVYERFHRTVVYLKNDPELVYKFHKMMLRAQAINSRINSMRNETLIRRREEIHSTRLHNHINSILNEISDTIYKAAATGKTYVDVCFEVSEMTLEGFLEVHPLSLGIPNSDGVLRTSFSEYVAYLLGCGETSEMTGCAYSSAYLLEKLAKKFPHFTIAEHATGKNLPTFRITFVELNADWWLI